MSSSSPLLTLPPELLLPILSLSLSTHPTPSHILSLSQHLHTLASPLLYTHLTFRSPGSMIQFRTHANPSRRPRSVEVDLAGGAVGGGAFRAMSGVFERCLQVGGEEKGERLELDELRLRLHSTSRAETDDVALNALGLVNPETFIWTGPDPAHHFSIAIIPTAFRALQHHTTHWTHLTSLHLSNLAFPSSSSPHIPASLFHLPAHKAASLIPQPAPPLPIPTPTDPEMKRTGREGEAEILFPSGNLPKLRSLYIGQATFVPLGALAAFICSRDRDRDSSMRRRYEGVGVDAIGPVQLESVRLVDCYVESIWGSRVRRSDVERAASELPLHLLSPLSGRGSSSPTASVPVVSSIDSGIGLDGDDRAFLGAERMRMEAERRRESVRRLVVCEAETERIMGGDRWG